MPLEGQAATIMVPLLGWLDLSDEVGGAAEALSWKLCCVSAVLGIKEY
jgi:hypothetical protein